MLTVAMSTKKSMAIIFMVKDIKSLKMLSLTKHLSF